MSIDAQLSHGEKVRRTLMSIDALSVGKDRPILTCSQSGNRELQGPWPLFCRAGSPDPARTATKNPAASWISWKSCFGFRSVRTLMSIDAQQEHGEKVRKDLNVYRRTRRRCYL